MWRIVWPDMNEVLWMLPPELAEMIMREVVKPKKEVEELKKIEVWDYRIKRSYYGKDIQKDSWVGCANCKELDQVEEMQRINIVWRVVLTQTLAMSATFYCKGCEI